MLFRSKSLETRLQEIPMVVSSDSSGHERSSSSSRRQARRRDKVKDTVEENVKVMSEDLECHQCHMRFKERQEVEQTKKHHFCAHSLLANPLRRDDTPTPGKQNSTGCVMCPGNPRPVFIDSRELMRHITLAPQLHLLQEGTGEEGVSGGDRCLH